MKRILLMVRKGKIELHSMSDDVEVSIANYDKNPKTAERLAKAWVRKQQSDQ